MTPLPSGYQENDPSFLCEELTFCRRVEEDGLHLIHQVGGPYDKDLLLLVEDQRLHSIQEVVALGKPELSDPYSNRVGVEGDLMDLGPLRTLGEERNYHRLVVHRVGAVLAIACRLPSCYSCNHCLLLVIF